MTATSGTSRTPGRLGPDDRLDPDGAAAVARRPLRLDAAVVRALRAGPAAGGLDLDSIVAAAWLLVSSRLTGSPDVAVDLDLAGCADGADDTIRLRASVDEDLPTPAYLRAVHESIRAARREPGPATTEHRLSLTVGDAGELVAYLTAHVEDPEVDQRDIEAGLDRLARVLEGFACVGDGPVRDVPMLSPEERGRILVDWNATGRGYPRGGLMHELFERQARRRPDAIAVAQRDHLVSYGALDASAESWARRFREAGAGPEIAVGVHLQRSAELVAVLLGVLKAGAAYLPLDPTYPRDRLEFMVEDSRMAILVTDRPELTLRHPVVIMQPDGRPPAARGGERPRHRTADGNTAYILYTSGSTGRPKGVMISHDNAIDLLHWSRETFTGSLDRVLATTSICFDCSILEIFGPLSWGGTAVLADSALDVATLDVRHDVRLLHSVPSVMAELLRLDRLPATVDTVLLGGEAPWPRLVDDIYRHSGVERLLNLYGPTEYTSYATMAVIDRESAATPPIGRPVANTRIHLLDRYGNPAPVGAPGELYIGGRGLARGYLRRPALTAQRFVPDPYAPAPGERAYRSGDLARYDESGVLTFIGRTDDQVKVRGVRVEPAEVERALLRHPAVGEVAVIAPTDGESRRRLIAHVVPSGPRPPTAAELRQYLSGDLPAALVPDSYVVVDRLPRMPNGKIDRSRLLPPSDADADADADAGGGCAAVPLVAPRDELEARLAALWSEAFDVERVGIHDDFYELGGQSLAAMRIRGRIADTLGVNPPIDLILSSRTVASLAAGLRPLLPDPLLPGAPTAADCIQPAERGFSGRETALGPLNAAGAAVPRGRMRAGDAAPLSPNQRAILARAEHHPADPTLHLPLCVRLTGPLRPAALTAALTALVRRHEILRTVLGATGTGERVQVIAPPAAIPLPLVDLSGVPAGSREELATELSVAAAREAFDLGRWPILHTVLFRLGEYDHVLSVTLHQLAGDVWSMAGVGRQLLELYGHAIAATEPDPTVPRVQYPDWAQWQVGWLGSEAGSAQRRFWRERLAGLPGFTPPGAASRRPSVDATSDSHDFALDGDLLGRILALGGQESATLYVVLLAAYELLLGRWSGQDRFAVGCPTTGRVHPDLAWTIGPFLNAIVMRADLAGDPSFRDLLRRTRDDAWEAYGNQDMPFAQLIADLDADGDPTRHPLFQASIVLHYLDEVIAPPGGLAVTDFGRRPAAHTALDLELAVYADDRSADCSLTYREDVLDAATVERFAASYIGLLREVVADPDLPISSYPLGGLAAEPMPEPMPDARPEPTPAPEPT